MNWLTSLIGFAPNIGDALGGSVGGILGGIAPQASREMSDAQKFGALMSLMGPKKEQPQQLAPIQQMPVYQPPQNVGYMQIASPVRNPYQIGLMGYGDQ